MSKRTLATVVLAILVAIFIVDLWARINHLYFSVWWIDNLMHFAGGLFVGLFSLYLYYFWQYADSKHKSWKFIIIFSVLVVSFIGILWEYFEFLLEVIIKRRFGPIELEFLTLPDTLFDLFFDITGGIIAAIIFIILWKKEV